MSQELFYTSAPNGLRPGSNGFCTVAMSAGLSATVAQRLEILSGYRELFPPGDPRTDQNPIAWSHWRLNLSGRAVSVLSRVCFAGMDYTQRTNTFAHHILLDTSEQSAGGPAWLMSQPEIMESEWTGSPRLLPPGRALPSGDDPPRVCTRWAELTGDAGWAGVLAGAAFPDPSRIAYIIYAPGTTILPLIREAMALLPQRLRWQVGFCTYFTELPASGSCAWRCCVAGTQAAKDAARLATSGVVIDLTRPLGAPPENPGVDAGRIGRLIYHEIEAAASPTPLRPRSMPPPSERPIPTQVAENVRAPSGAQAFAAGIDQSWMPPASATVVERDRSEAEMAANRNGSSSRTRPVFWIIALLWPLLVITAVVAWHFFYAVPATIVDLQATRDELKGKLAHADQQLKTETSQHQEQIKAKDLEIAAEKNHGAQESATVRERDKTIESQKGELARIETARLQLQSQLAQRPPATTSPTPTTQVATAVVSPPASQPASQPVQVREVTADVLHGITPLWTDHDVHATDIELLSPQLPKGIEITQEKRSDGVRLSIKQKENVASVAKLPASEPSATSTLSLQIPESDPGRVSAGPLATVELREGTLYWSGNVDRLGRVPGLSGWLRASGVQLIRDKQVVGVVWLQGPSNIQFNVVGSDTQPQIPDTPSGELDKLYLTVGADFPKDWIGSPDADGRGLIVASQIGREAKIKFTFIGSRLSTNRTTVYSDLKSELQSLQNEAIPKFKNDIEQSNRDKRAEDSNRAQENLRAAQGEAQEKDLALKAIEEMPDFMIVVRHLDTKASICNVKVRIRLK